VEPIERLRKTLGEYYSARRRKHTVAFPNIYDADLRRLFSDQAHHRRKEAASSYLRRHRSEVRSLVAKWTGEYQYTLDQVLGDIIGRCGHLRLRVVGSERQVLSDFIVLLTVKTMHFLYEQGRNWIRSGDVRSSASC
jgi:hypothetical protein